MTKANPACAEGAMVVTMQNIYTIANAACTSVGDMSLVEYVLLLNASEIEPGLPLRCIQSDFERFGEPQHYVGLLEKKELAIRVRSRIDRRSLALKATPKGKARATLVDEALATSLIGASERLSEDALEHLILKLRLFADVVAIAGQRVAGFFPSSALLMLCRYHRLVANESAFSGMSSLQTAVLFALDRYDETLSVALLAHRFAVTEDIMRFQLEHLRDRRAVRGESTFELTEEGRRRVDEFACKFSASLEATLADMPEQDTSQLEELSQHCMYLFA